jgi:uncharacterized RDD family membrane protein YckC
VVYAVPVPAEGESVFEPSTRRTLMRVPLHDDAPPEAIVEIEGSSGDPVLLAHGETLWAIDDGGITFVRDGATRRIALAEDLPGKFWPVIVDDGPAVVTLAHDDETDTHRLALAVLEGDRFVVRHSVLTVPGFDPRQLRVVSAGGALHLFVDGWDAPVHHAVWETGRGAPGWAPMPIEGSEWTAVALGGVPAVFALDESAETAAVVGWRRSPGWRRFMSESAESAHRIGAVSLPDGRVAVTTDTMLDGIAVAQVDGDGLVARHEHSGSSLMQETVGIIVASAVAPILLSLLLALLLARRMRIHRVGEYVVEHRVARYASLTRRALARAVDGAIAAVVPLLVLLPRALDGSLDEGVVTGVCLLWGVPVGIGLTLLEGKYGQTPGKRLLGIRVVGLDLRAPGIGAAFVRGLVGIVDGLFDFIVGIVAVATSVHWQRIGDQVAHTIVIDDAVVQHDAQGEYQLR